MRKKGCIKLLAVLFLAVAFSLPSRPAPAIPTVLPDFTQIAKEANEFMVNIYTTQVVERRVMGPEDMFRFFFGNQFNNLRPGVPRKFKRRSLGSGFIINPKGYILTNNHVVKSATKIKVKLHDGSTYKAKLVGADPKTDIALIKIDPKDKPLASAKLGNSDKVQIGEWVLAVGNPFGLSYTVTAGIISAKGRVIGEGPYDNFLQTDASINPGNSGGPLINMEGKVIGINTAIVAQGQGIGFAIPINMAKEILPQLRTRGKVIRGWLGVYVQALTPELSKSFGLKKTEGPVVTQVMGDSPAEKAGVKEGDIIVEFNGKKIKDTRELPHLVAMVPPGKVVPVKILRNGKEKTIKVKIGTMPEEKVSLGGSPSMKAKLGLKVAPLPPEVAQQTGIRGGVYVVEVKPGSPAEESGIHHGDIILRVNRHKIKNLKDFNMVMAKTKPGEVVAFLIRRGNSSFYVAIQMR
jgi:serine protease Do